MKPSRKKTFPAAMPPHEPDLDEALRLVMQLMAIPGPSGREGAVAEFIVRHLRDAGAPRAAILSDKVNRRAPISGDVGNLRLPPPRHDPRFARLLMAHMDTVPLCVGSRPVLEGGVVRSADPATALGADDRAGAAVLLAAALAILRGLLPHPPLTFLWTIQEEIGLYGARLADLSLLGSPKLSFNWDGGTVGRVTLGATGGYRMEIEIAGQAAHAGVSPEQGVSAVAIAGLAIAELQQNGWHGDVRKGAPRHQQHRPDRRATTNIVTDRVRLRAEARSHDARFRERIIQAYETAFRRAARQIRSATGRQGKVEIAGRLDYEAFRLADDDPSVLAAEAALRHFGIEPIRSVSNGGLDANWLSARGIPTVTLGCGQVSPHTQSERLDVAAFQTACRVAFHLATAAE